MSEPMRTRIDFSPETEITEQAPGPSARRFSEAELFTPVSEAQDESHTAAANIVDTTLRPKSSLWRRLALIGVGLFGVSALAQGVTWTLNAWQTQDWVALSAGLAGTCVIVAGAGALASEWRKLIKLKARAHERDEAQCLLESHGMGQGRAFCEKLAKQAGLSLNHPALQRWHSAIQETHNDREVVTLYAQYVQPTLDAQAQREIGKSAAASAIMIAVSPIALVDMAFIAWRNVRLINRIAEIYGIELGYFSRVRLFRLVLINIAFAGASEMISDVGLDWVSQDITARLSSRAAQGLGAGLLTARLGVKAMALCRPLPWTEQDKPRLGDFRQQIVAQLKETLTQRPSNKP